MHVRGDCPIPLFVAETQAALKGVRLVPAARLLAAVDAVPHFGKNISRPPVEGSRATVQRYLYSLRLRTARIGSNAITRSGCTSGISPSGSNRFSNLGLMSRMRLSNVLADNTLQFLRVGLENDLDPVVRKECVERDAHVGIRFPGKLRENVVVRWRTQFLVDNEVQIAAARGKEPLFVVLAASEQQRRVVDAQAEFHVPPIDGLQRVHQHHAAHTITKPDRESAGIYLDTFNRPRIDNAEDALIVANMKRVEQFLPVQHDADLVAIAAAQVGFRRRAACRRAGATIGENKSIGGVLIITISCPHVRPLGA